MGNLIHPPWNQACYRCGEPGHVRAACPQAAKMPAAPAADAARVRGEIPPPVPPRRPLEEISDYPREAAAVRAALGWDRETHDQELRRRAREQAAESRRERELFPVDTSGPASDPSVALAGRAGAQQQPSPETRQEPC